MLWSLWILAPDIWLIYQGCRNWWIPILAIVSGLVNVAISIGLFFFLVHAIKRITERWSDRQFFIALAEQFKAWLERSQQNGHKLAIYMEQIRMHKYLFLYCLNLLPLIPWITGGTVGYAVVAKDHLAFLFIILGLASKVLLITAFQLIFGL